jgi:hypothetical protein
MMSSWSQLGMPSLVPADWDVFTSSEQSVNSDYFGCLRLLLVVTNGTMS